MAKIWKISEAASIGLHAAVYLATTRDRLVQTREMAQLLDVSEAHLSKVLQLLARAGLVRAVRGPTGGFELVGDPSKISLLEVYEAIEGPLLPVKCLLRRQICDGTHCILGGLVEQVNDGVREYLAKTQLSELTQVYNPRSSPQNGKSRKK